MHILGITADDPAYMRRGGTLLIPDEDDANVVAGIVNIIPRDAAPEVESHARETRICRIGKRGCDDIARRHERYLPQRLCIGFDFVNGGHVDVPRLGLVWSGQHLGAQHGQTRPCRQ
mmetsp:Transcript_41010/g.59941  ORF Transcript_41010/g.59941 Transcript_41010/m.59941 type:complete len:117 (+) Transcript_41010:305-655(+)